MLSLLLFWVEEPPLSGNTVLVFGMNVNDGIVSHWVGMGKNV